MEADWDKWLGHLSEADKAIHVVLYDWFCALNDGTAAHRMPDFGYVRPEGAEEWTDARLENLIKVIDDYVWAQAAWCKTTRFIDADAGPGYARLGPAQRVAFAQDLERAVQAFPPPAPAPTQEFYAD